MLHGEETVTFRVSKAALYHFKNLPEAANMMSVLSSDECHSRAMKRKWRMLPSNGWAVGGPHQIVFVLWFCAGGKEGYRRGLLLKNELQNADLALWWGWKGCATSGTSGSWTISETGIQAYQLKHQMSKFCLIENAKGFYIAENKSLAVEISPQIFKLD